MNVRARIGVLVPVANPTVEPELYRMAPPEVTLHFARFGTREDAPGYHAGMERRLLAYLDTLPDAVSALAAVRPAAVVLAHTSVSYAAGFDAEPGIMERLAGLAGCPVLTASRAILAAFTHLGVRRIALATPYPAAVEALGVAYWRAAGVTVVSERRLEGVASIYDESEARAYALGREIDSADAEALLISGTGLPTAGIVARLEADLGLPVVTGTTAALWQALRVADVGARVAGFGRLLAGG